MIPFKLLEVAARGGMGVVWRAVHRGTGVPVAVKVMTGAYAREDEWRQVFAREARAAANLDHPAVVRVLDFGRVGAGDPELPEGSPWLAMEWAGGGTLAQARDPWGWGEVRGLLVELLAGLGHAHARGILHRDLKPANVLRGGPDLEQWKLADFGIARLMGEAGDGLVDGWGTPHYMAPEQTTPGRGADQGPWTDLYALGCLAWHLVTGAVPFDGEASLVRQAHRMAPLPPFVPRIGVPARFEGWLQRLLAKEPADRWAFAADAAAALDDLGPPERFDRALPFFLPGRVVSSQATWSLTHAAAETGIPAAHRTLVPDGDHAPPRAGRPRAAPAPFPADWRGAATLGPARADPLVGLGVLGLRPVPLVDRETERDRLWTALGRVGRAGRTGFAAVIGPAGTGKSRLAEWLGVTAHERGVARWLRVLHAADPGPQDGVVAALGRHLAAREVDPAVLRARLAGAGEDEDESDALVRLLRGELDSRAPTAERHALIVAALRRLAVDRPLVVVVEDPVLDPDAMGWLAAALAEPRAPVLLVATVRAEALAERPEAEAALERLLGTPGAERLVLGNLGEEDRVLLVRNLLGLEPGLAAQVETRTAGNPLFAVQLVRAWSESGRLVRGDGGFRLLGDADALPADLDAVWRDRLARVLDPLEPAAAASVELAAVLGSPVDGAEWRAACAQAGLEPSLHALERLYAARLAFPAGADGWALGHGLLREALLERARGQARLRPWHRACADALAARGEPALAERIGHHRLEAGQPREALPALLAAAVARRLAGEPGRSLALLDDAARAAEAAGLPPADPDWGRLWTERAESLRFSGLLDEAQALIGRTLVDADRHGWRFYRARLLFEAAECARSAGRIEEGIRLARASVNAHLALGPEGRPGPAFASLSAAMRQVGRAEEALVAAEQACAAYAAQDPGHSPVMGLLILGVAQNTMGRCAEARASLEQARDAARAGGFRMSEAACVLNLGNVDLQEGRIEEAAAAFLYAERVYRRAGHPHANLAAGSAGRTLAALGRVAQARELLSRSGTTATEAPRSVVSLSALTGWFAIEVAERRWDAAERTLLSIESAVSAMRLYDGALAWCFRWSAGRAEDAGRPQLAARLDRLYAAQCAGLGPRTESADSR